MNILRVMVYTVIVAAFSTVVYGEDVDIRSLQAKIAAQDALLKDLESKTNRSIGYANANYDDAPEGIISLNKNATVTIGGLLTTAYTYKNGRIDSVFANPDIDGFDAGTESVGNQAPGIYQDRAFGGQPAFTRRAKASQGDLFIDDAMIYLQIDVNDHFDAYIEMNLQESNWDGSDNAEVYYVRWKDICNSGFGIKVGRDALVFGDDNSVGWLSSHVGDNGDAHDGILWGDYFDSVYSSRLAHYDEIMPRHNMWDISGITQVTPYWEGLDGKLLAEVSFFQNFDSSGRISNSRADLNQIYVDGHTYKSRNYGFGSMSARIAYSPIEDLKFSASVVNFHDKANGTFANREEFAKNNTATSLAFSYRPAAFNRLYTWGQWIHGWNVDGLRDVDSDALNFGASFDLTDQFCIFAQGDYVLTKDKLNNNDDRASAWAVYTGLSYTLPYGVNLELGWKHEEVTWKQNIGADNAGDVIRTGNRAKTLKGKADVIYGQLGFEF